MAGRLTATIAVLAALVALFSFRALAASTDTDGDGWTDDAELFIGTDPLDICSWPPDSDADGAVSISDVFFISTRFGAADGSPGYTPGAELASQNGTIGIDDVFASAARFGGSSDPGCLPTPSPTPTPTPAPTPQTTGFLSPSADAAVTTGSGDNNGFEQKPTHAYSDDGKFAADKNSGTNTSTSCTDTGKDRHQFYSYGFSIPAGATINGIEVRLDASVEKVSPGDPFMCLELSWDGGATWTTVTKTTPILGKSEATFILGSAGDTWGRTWSDTDFTNANFRIRITNVSTDNQRDLRLYWVPVQVTYTP